MSEQDSFAFYEALEQNDKPEEPKLRGSEQSYKRAETFKDLRTYPYSTYKKIKNQETARMPNTIHRPIDGKRNIERQTREQRTVNQVLSGITLTIICGIVLVGALAGTGGYVLFKQINQQSVTISDLENNSNMRLAALEERLLIKHAELTEAFANSNRRIMELATNFEQYRNETTENLKKAQTNINTLYAENRRLKKQISSYERRLDEQNDLISLYEARRSRFFR